MEGRDIFLLTLFLVLMTALAHIFAVERSAGSASPASAARPSDLMSLAVPVEA